MSIPLEGYNTAVVEVRIRSGRLMESREFVVAHEFSSFCEGFRSAKPRNRQLTFKLYIWNPNRKKHKLQKDWTENEIYDVLL